MNPFPAEVWIQIYALACTDTGKTAESLSLVCKTSYEYVEEFRYQSLALLRPNDLVKLSIHLSRIPPERRETRYLFVAFGRLMLEGKCSKELVASPERYIDPDELSTYLDRLSMSSGQATKEEVYSTRSTRAETGAMIQLQESHMLKSLYLTLTLSSSTLVILSIHLPWLARGSILPRFEFPRLEELTVYGASGFGPFIQASGVPYYPSLMRLHVSQAYASSIIEEVNSSTTPRLSHLYLHLHSMSPLRILDSFDTSLGSPTVDLDSDDEPVRFPDGLRNVYLEILEGAGSESTHLRVLNRAKEINLLSDINIRVCSRPPGRWQDVWTALQDWEERIEGREGRWQKGILSLLENSEE